MDTYGTLEAYWLGDCDDEDVCVCVCACIEREIFAPDKFD